MTQAQLAARLGYTGANVSKWEGDVNEPPLDVLRQLRAILGVSVDLLLQVADTPPRALVNVKLIRRATRKLVAAATVLEGIAQAVGDLEQAVPPEEE